MAKQGIWSEFRDFMSSVISFPQDFLGAFGLPPSSSGAIVNEFSAIQIAAYFACIRVISDAIGTIPLNVYERKDDGSEVLALSHPLFSTLHTQPNPEVTAADMRQAAQSHILVDGNAYMEIIFTNGGQVDSLYLRSPFTTFPYRSQAGDLIYKTHDDPSGAERIIPAYRMLHVKGLGIDSLVGLSPVKYFAREILGIEISAQSYAAKYFANQATPSGYLSSPGQLKPQQKLTGLNSWMQAHSKGNSHMPAILEQGWEWHDISHDPQKSQLVELRNLNREQICAIFGVPSHMAGGQEDTKATAEQKALDFLNFTLKPWLKKWEQAINAKLFPKVGRNANRFFAKFDTTELERADYKTMMQGLQMARYAGGLTANEMRKAMGLNPYEQAQLESKNPADRLLQPVNMQFVSADMLEAPPVPPAPGSDTESEGENPVSKSKDTAKPKGVTETNSVDQEITHYIRTYSGVFTDAFNRIQARKKPDEKDFERIFQPVLVSIAAAFTLDPTDSEPVQMELPAELMHSVDEYIAGMVHRSKEWKNGVATASSELRRAIEYLRSKAQAATSVVAGEE